jgi:hypothetical protein
VGAGVRAPSYVTYVLACGVRTRMYSRTLLLRMDSRA